MLSLTNYIKTENLNSYFNYKFESKYCDVNLSMLLQKTDFNKYSRFSDDLIHKRNCEMIIDYQYENLCNKMEFSYFNNVITIKKNTSRNRMKPYFIKFKLNRILTIFFTKLLESFVEMWKNDETQIFSDNPKTSTKKINSLHLGDSGRSIMVEKNPVIADSLNFKIKNVFGELDIYLNYLENDFDTINFDSDPNIWSFNENIKNKIMELILCPINNKNEKTPLTIDFKIKSEGYDNFAKCFELNI